MNATKISYYLLNTLFHLLHSGIILFVMTGWAVPAWRLWHLMLVVLTLGSWFILGRWKGAGYCPVSDWHWRLKRSMGGGAPEGSYILLLLRILTRREPDPVAVDKTVVAGTMLILAVSLLLNIRDWLT